MMCSWCAIHLHAAAYGVILLKWQLKGKRVAFRHNEFFPMSLHSVKRSLAETLHHRQLFCLIEKKSTVPTFSYWYRCSAAKWQVPSHFETIGGCAWGWTEVYLTFIKCSWQSETSCIWPPGTFCSLRKFLLVPQSTQTGWVSQCSTLFSWSL